MEDKHKSDAQAAWISKILFVYLRHNNKIDTMHLLDKKQLLYLKKNYFTPNKKKYCKKLEQQDGEISFKVNNKKYIVVYKNSKTYTNYIAQNTKNNTGSMHKGNKTRVQDFYNKTNYNELNLHKKIDKTL